MSVLLGVLTYLSIGFTLATLAAAWFGPADHGDEGFLLFPILVWPLCLALGALFGLMCGAYRLGLCLRKTVRR